MVSGVGVVVGVRFGRGSNVPRGVAVILGMDLLKLSFIVNVEIFRTVLASVYPEPRSDSEAGVEPK